MTIARVFIEDLEAAVLEALREHGAGLEAARGLRSVSLIVTMDVKTKRPLRVQLRTESQSEVRQPPRFPPVSAR